MAIQAPITRQLETIAPEPILRLENGVLTELQTGIASPEHHAFVEKLQAQAAE